MKTLVTAIAGFVVFAPVTFIWHTVLFKGMYIGPTFSVKSEEGLSPGWIVGASALLCLGMAYFLPPRLSASNRVLSGAVLGAALAFIAVQYHNFSLMGLFPGQDPASLYWMDAAWSVLDGAIAGVVMTLVDGRLSRPAARPA